MIGVRRLVAFIDKCCQFALVLGGKRQDVLSPMIGCYKELEVTLDFFKRRGAIHDYMVITNADGLGGHDIKLKISLKANAWPHERITISYHVEV